MDSTTMYKPTLHEHPLFYSARFMLDTCYGCGIYECMYGGYTCNYPNCDCFFHKECAEAPVEIDHPSHAQHHLLFTPTPKSGIARCDFCGDHLAWEPCYSCPTCKFIVDLRCGIKPSPLAIEHPLCHDHPLVFKKYIENLSCELCKKTFDGPSYMCLQCNNVYFHIRCINFSKAVNHPCHCNHPLKLTAIDTLTHDAEKTCLLCGELEENIIYRCSICNISMCLDCTRNPPPLVVEHMKTHEHPLTRFPKKLSYICDFCGLKCNTMPYVCLQCGFVIDYRCIDLPRVININRHDHRISFTHHLGPGYSTCGVCHQSLSEYHGAYSCSICPNYATHSKCAVKYSSWDLVELEEIPDDMEDIAPFKVVGENLISHFSHDKHFLRFQKGNAIRTKWLQCEACMHPVGFGSIYNCEECGFFLHENCANLPLKKRIVFGTIPFTLKIVGRVSYCGSCRTLSDGFKYTSQDHEQIDVHCASILEPFVHDGHLHPLYFVYGNFDRYCQGCNDDVSEFMLHCDACDFTLCLYCAGLPDKIWYKNDDEHPLILYCGQKASDKNWCDICERELDPCNWFYTCFDCEITLHTRCILGDFSRLKPGAIFDYDGAIGFAYKFEVVLNNHNTRPDCSICCSRCKISVILKHVERDEYFCSRTCFLKFCHDIALKFFSNEHQQ